MNQFLQEDDLYQVLNKVNEKIGLKALCFLSFLVVELNG